MISTNNHSTAVPSRMLQHAGATAACGTFTPEDDEPISIVVGALASSDRIARLAKKHGLDPVDLLNFARQE